MELHGLLQTFPKYVKLFIASFVVVLSIGYSTGLLFVRQTQSVSPDGIEQNYLGNEDIENVKVMKFEKGAREMLTIIHTHILSMSFIFFFLGGLLAMTSIPKRWKAFLMIEPFFSILITFGGIYFMWMGVIWLKYIVMLSGVLMTLAYFVSAGVVLYECFKNKNT
ncbi:hypothetical protein N9Q21_02845 [Flavobacteriaceae bacterium]|jgi:hypothetical protein|nr:hypothetical protein [Bacteroidota bacterium]MDA9215966.1 hypothetical protein [Flavobacteriaceae bacterium]MDB2630868.1 hypothetical protein [Ulvibacter sp.]MBT5871211.1 hypothetical protein [Bacteroidota bacterium]MBT7306110.1 hypothetical protein [Bacteroidota bacterium]|tara:strand:+ start:324 stop:818 length:495 start_codon:yes stop_codon:yes gene_type:complete